MKVSKIIPINNYKYTNFRSNKFNIAEEYTDEYSSITVKDAAITAGVISVLAIFTGIVIDWASKISKSIKF